MAGPKKLSEYTDSQLLALKKAQTQGLSSLSDIELQDLKQAQTPIEPSNKAPAGSMGYIGKGDFAVPGMNPEMRKIAQDKANEVVINGLAMMAPVPGIGSLKGLSALEKLVAIGEPLLANAAVSGAQSGMLSKSKDISGKLKDTAEGAAWGAAIPTAFKTGGSLLGWAADKVPVKNLLTRLLSKTSGLSESSLKEYIKDPEFIRKLASGSEGDNFIKQHYRAIKNALKDELDVYSKKIADKTITPEEMEAYGHLKDIDNAYFNKTEIVTPEVREPDVKIPKKVETVTKEMPDEIDSGRKFINTKNNINEVSINVKGKGISDVLQKQASDLMDLVVDSKPNSFTPITRSMYSDAVETADLLKSITPEKLEKAIKLKDKVAIERMQNLRKLDPKVGEAYDEFINALNTGKGTVDAANDFLQKARKAANDRKEMAYKAYEKSVDDVIKEHGPISIAPVKQHVNDFIQNEVSNRTFPETGMSIGDQEIVNNLNDLKRKSFMSEIENVTPESVTPGKVIQPEVVRDVDQHNPFVAKLKSANTPAGTEGRALKETVNSLPNVDPEDFKSFMDKLIAAEELGGTGKTAPKVISNRTIATVGGLLGSSFFGLPYAAGASMLLPATSPLAIRAGIDAYKWSSPYRRFLGEEISNAIPRISRMYSPYLPQNNGEE